MNDILGPICGKCWRKLPQAMRDRHRQIQRRDRRLLRRIERRVAAGTISRALVEKISAAITAQCNESWDRIRNYFQTPEWPIGLEGFLQEVGL